MITNCTDKWGSKVKVTQSCLTHCDPMDCCPWNSPGQNTRVGSLSLLQGIFPTQGSSPCLPNCRQILFQLSHQGSPRILQWVAYPFSSRSSQPRNQTGVSPIKGRFFTNWAIRGASIQSSHILKLWKIKPRKRVKETFKNTSFNKWENYDLAAEDLKREYTF